MKKVERYLERLYEERIEEQYDHILLVVGDEGHGKSTLMLQMMVLWQMIREGYDDASEVDVEDVLSSIVHSPEGFEEAMAGFAARSAIAVPDAGRVMHKKEAMAAEQRELEKDLLDVRTNEYLILMGYQYWSTVPSFLMDGRAKGALYIPKRGLIQGYSRETLNDDIEDDDVPPADLVDTFPSLEGTELWREYRRIDQEQKAKRMDADDEDGEGEGWTVREVVGDIEDRDALGDFVLTHNQNGRPYIDADLIEYEYGVSARKAKQVKKVLERDHDVSDHSPEVGEA